MCVRRASTGQLMARSAVMARCNFGDGSHWYARTANCCSGLKLLVQGRISRRWDDMFGEPSVTLATIAVAAIISELWLLVRWSDASDRVLSLLRASDMIRWDFLVVLSISLRRFLLCLLSDLLLNFEQMVCDGCYAHIFRIW